MASSKDHEVGGPGPRPSSAVHRVERAGKYEILGHIAKGGMAELQLARAVGIEGFEKLVVIKRILPHLSTNRDFVEMFLDEARIAATLHHSNIVQVYDIGSIDGDYFFSMEFLHGEDVRHIMRAAQARERAIPIEHAISIGLGVCAALHYAHSAVGLDGSPSGIVHRDVSPQNAIVTYDGGVKLVDFGIAKAAHRLTETRAGTLKGKVQYMSPEQCLQEPLDARSDVFAAAILLWELTTGQQLFGGTSEFAILKAIVESDATPPSQKVPGYPAQLERIVMKGLRRNRLERYQSAQELQADLEDFAREQRLAVSPIGLARFMRDLFGERINALSAAKQVGGHALVEHVIHTIDLRTDELRESQLRSPASAPARDHTRRARLAAAANAQGRTGPRTRSLLPHGATSRAWAIGAAVTTLFAVAMALVAVKRAPFARRKLSAPTERAKPGLAPVAVPPTTSSPPTAAPAPAQPKPIAVAVRRSPTNARLTLDGAKVDGDWVTFADDGMPHTLRVTAPGYVAQTRALDARSDGTMLLFLKRQGQAGDLARPEGSAAPRQRQLPPVLDP